MRARWIGLAVIVVIAFTIGVYFLSTEGPPPHRVTVLVVAYTYPTFHIPTGNLPFNESAATQYVNDFINDYQAEGQTEAVAHPDLAHTASFFPFYYPTGSWKVIIARDNLSNADDWIEFQFVKQITASNPELVFYTNEMGPYLRPLPYVTGKPFHSGAFNVWTLYGQGYESWDTQSPAGITTLPLVWRVNYTSIYDNTTFNAESAAVALYNVDVQHLENHLNPPFPTLGWFENLPTNPLAYVIGVVVFVLIPWYFGGFAAFIEWVNTRREKEKALKQEEEMFRHQLNEEERKKKKNPKK